MSGSDVKNQKDLRAQAGLRASLIGLIANVGLAAAKIIAGMLSGAVSILADGVNNLSDAGSVVVSMLSLRMARKP
ncbi:MAG: cation transporter, partial [Clostridiales bacterium]|nr:cation transporter [Clostridiales bacterium]